MNAIIATLFVISLTTSQGVYTEVVPVTLSDCNHQAWYMIENVEVPEGVEMTVMCKVVGI